LLYRRGINKSRFCNTGIELFLCDNKDDGWSILEARHCWLYRFGLVSWRRRFFFKSACFEGTLKIHTSLRFLFTLLILKISEAVKDSGQLLFRKLNSWGCKGNFSDIRTQVESWLNTNRQQNFQVFISKRFTIRFIKPLELK